MTSRKTPAAFRAMSKRFDSLFGSTNAVSKLETEEEGSTVEMPLAKVDMALVGVEHTGKSTFFKQITSIYTPDDFKMLVRSDGKSQAIGTLLKITLTLLKPVYEEFQSRETRKAADALLNSITHYNLSKKSAAALKIIWADPEFLSVYKQSSFFQPLDFLAEVENCENLIDINFKVSKQLHLKLHNPTHGYNSTKFTFISAHNAVDDGEASSGNGKMSKRNSENRKQSSMTPESSNVRPQSIGGAILSMTKRNTRVLQSLSKNFRVSQAPKKLSEVKLKRRSNEVRMWDLGGLFEKRTDWEYFLRRSNVALFFCSLADYAVTVNDGSEENVLQDSLNMFKVLCESDFLKDRTIHVVLTKRDVFETRLRHMRVSIHQSGLFEGAPTGFDEFDVGANLEFIKDLFINITKTENSYLTARNVEFHVVNCFDERMVRELFIDCVSTIKPEEKPEPDANSEQLDPVLARLQKEQEEKSRTRGLSLKILKFSLLKKDPEEKGHLPIIPPRKSKSRKHKSTPPVATNARSSRTFNPQKMATDNIQYRRKKKSSQIKN